jgi:transcriptional regulator with XRE-family HTH domain
MTRDAKPDAEILQQFGRRLGEVRRRRGWSQVELARRTDCLISMISRYERGVHWPGPGVLARLRRELRVSLDYLVAGQAGGIRDTRLVKLLRRVDALSPRKVDEVVQLLEVVLEKELREQAGA